MAQHGGYRRPANPAPVSGPGAHSRRTDGNFQSVSTVGGQDYGQAKADAASQAIAPMGGATPLPSAPPVQPAPAGDGGAAQLQHPQQYMGGAFNAPSQRPDEPTTAGAAGGAGPGPESLNLPTPDAPAQSTGQMTAMLTSLSSADTTGVLGQLLIAARDRGA